VAATTVGGPYGTGGGAYVVADAYAAAAAADVAGGKENEARMEAGMFMGKLLGIELVK
jgi:hypothetical protein